MKRGLYRLFGGLTATCLWIFGCGSAAAQTVDISDFLVLESGAEWALAGKATLVYSGIPANPDVECTIKTSVGSVLHGEQTRKLVLLAGGDVGSGFLTMFMSIQQTLELRLADTGLYLHSRAGGVYMNGVQLDFDQEVYNAPAKLLPRLITIGTPYAFTADLTTGEVEDVVVPEAIETIDTAEGPIEAIKLVLFSQAKTPVILWLGRNIGPVKAQVDTTFSGNPMGLYAILTSTNLPWKAAPIDTFWAASLNEGDGWRSAKSLGSFWIPDTDSPWIGHPGFGWAYCDGDITNLWFYLPGAGWFWTSTDLYPFMYSEVHGELLYYLDLPGSHLFWSYLLGQYLDLTPGG